MEYAHATASSGTQAGQVPWGTHMILDLGRCRREAATDPDRIRSFIAELVSEIDMRAYGDPLVAHFAEHTPEAAGWSVVQLIETSNITAHFCDLHGDAYLDVFSCKQFDPDVVVALVERRLQPESVSVTLIHRQA